MRDDLKLLLDEWKAMSAAATPGPWSAADEHGANCLWCVSQMRPGFEEMSPTEGYVGDVAEVGDSEADATFIAASRTLVPRLIAAVEAVLEEHRPVEVEPSDTICGECSFRLPNGRYFGKVVEWPCPTVAAIRSALIGGDDD